MLCGANLIGDCFACNTALQLMAICFVSNANLRGCHGCDLPRKVTKNSNTGLLVKYNEEYSLMSRK
mgnify:CR=1 FL=1